MTTTHRHLIVLSIALLCGLAAAWLAARHIDHLAAEVEAELAEPYDKRPVLVAQTALTAGEALSADDVAVRSMPKTYTHAQALGRDGWSRIAGRILQQPLEPGDPILPAMLRQDEHTRLSELVSTGDRALTIPVPGEQAIAGLLRPGDRVDLLLTYRRDGQQTTTTLLSDVVILATGPHLQGAGSGPAPGQLGYSELTVAVAHAEAVRVTQALAVGEISVVLRSDKDDRSMPRIAIGEEQLLDHRAAREGEHRAVEVIRGGAL
jgi:pilus assembly protein CpaB